ncbi:hypothetical protein EVAR_43743_1 [Eumeta japonica]|uniref:Uncharacterized protein n=1 Tax=Eumeta variegata TaxID=151549 RepID=A0A4C1Y532_EUMVA|nr:hypothetical protein EVAR_43743_1 [Eumeta japonica]
MNSKEEHLLIMMMAPGARRRAMSATASRVALTTAIMFTLQHCQYELKRRAPVDHDDGAGRAPPRHVRDGQPRRPHHCHNILAPTLSI